MKPFPSLRLLLLPALLLTQSVHALINPTLQPNDLGDRYHHVLLVTVTRVNSADQTAEFEVTELISGGEVPREIRVSVADDGQPGGLLSLGRGQRLVVFLSNRVRGQRDRMLLYVGAGTWFNARIHPEDPAHWLWGRNADEGVDASSTQIMFGTFNGHVDRLAEMMRDRVHSRYYFPPHPFVRFAEAIDIARLDGGVRAVAVFDLTGDGRLELLAAGPAGTRVFAGTPDQGFDDITARLGLDGLPASSISLADVNGNGRADLLLGHRILLQQEDGRFEAADLLPGAEDTEILSSAFIDVNANGYPDVLLSLRDGGPRLFLNPGEDGGPFEDATADWDLDDPDLAEAPGRFSAADFTGNGRADLFLGAAPGAMLLNENGRFELIRGADAGIPAIEGDFSAPAAGAFWKPDQTAFVSAHEAGYVILARIDDWPADVAPYGNETSERPFEPGFVIGEDLNADGTVDLFTVSRAPRGGTFFLNNRGYGSFMYSRKYSGGNPLFPTSLLEQGATAAVAADVNADGAIDLLVGREDGTLSLYLNQTLAAREQTAESRLLHDRIRYNSRLLTVELRGPLGATGATVRLETADGRGLALRQTGNGAGGGSQGPNRVILAIREPGEHLLIVRFTDGRIQRRAIDLTDAAPRHQTLLIANGE